MKEAKGQEPAMSDATLLLKVDDLINMAMGPAEQNMVNFKMIQTILHILARQMRMLEQQVEIRISEVQPRGSVEDLETAGRTTKERGRVKEKEDMTSKERGKSERDGNRETKGSAKEKDTWEKSHDQDQSEDKGRKGRKEKSRKVVSGERDSESDKESDEMSLKERERDGRMGKDKDSEKAQRDRDKSRKVEHEKGGERSERIKDMDEIEDSLSLSFQGKGGNKPAPEKYDESLEEDLRKMAPDWDEKRALDRKSKKKELHREKNKTVEQDSDTDTGTKKESPVEVKGEERISPESVLLVMVDDDRGERDKDKPKIKQSKSPRIEREDRESADTQLLLTYDKSDLKVELVNKILLRDKKRLWKAERDKNKPLLSDRDRGIGEMPGGEDERARKKPSEGTPKYDIQTHKSKKTHKKSPRGESSSGGRSESDRTREASRERVSGRRERSRQGVHEKDNAKERYKRVPSSEIYVNQSTLDVYGGRRKIGSHEEMVPSRQGERGPLEDEDPELCIVYGVLPHEKGAEIDQASFDGMEQSEVNIIKGEIKKEKLHIDRIKQSGIEGEFGQESGKERKRRDHERHEKEQDKEDESLEEKVSGTRTEKLTFSIQDRDERYRTETDKDREKTYDHEEKERHGDKYHVKKNTRQEADREMEDRELSHGKEQKKRLESDRYSTSEGKQIEALQKQDKTELAEVGFDKKERDRTKQDAVKRKEDVRKIDRGRYYDVDEREIEGEEFPYAKERRKNQEWDDDEDRYRQRSGVNQKSGKVKVENDSDEDRNEKTKIRGKEIRKRAKEHENIETDVDFRTEDKRVQSKKSPLTKEVEKDQAGQSETYKSSYKREGLRRESRDSQLALSGDDYLIDLSPSDKRAGSGRTFWDVDDENDDKTSLRDGNKGQDKSGYKSRGLKDKETRTEKGGDLARRVRKEERRYSHEEQYETEKDREARRERDRKRRGDRDSYEEDDARRRDTKKGAKDEYYDQGERDRVIGRERREYSRERDQESRAKKRGEQRVTDTVSSESSLENVSKHGKQMQNGAYGEYEARGIKGKRSKEEDESYEEYSRVGKADGYRRDLSEDENRNLEFDKDKGIKHRQVGRDEKKRDDGKYFTEDKAMTDKIQKERSRGKEGELYRDIDTRRGSTISITEVERRKEKVLVAERRPAPPRRPARVGSIEVVTQSQFGILEDAVSALKDMMKPTSMPMLPNNQRLREEIAKGNTSLTDSMHAMQLSARVNAAETGIKRMTELLTQLATMGALPSDLTNKAADLEADIEALGEIGDEMETISGPSRKGHVPDAMGQARKSVAIDPSAAASAASSRTVASRGGCASAATRASAPPAAVVCVTHPEMDEALRNLKEELMKNLQNMTSRATTSAETAFNSARAVAEKIEVATKLDQRITTLHALVSDYAEQLSGFDAGLATQMSGFQEQMAQMRNDLTSGLAQLEQVNNNAETAVVMELTERYELLVGELETTMYAHQGLDAAHAQLSDELRSLIEAVETMREQKADRDEVLDGLRDKADISRLVGLLTEREFQDTRDELQLRLDVCHDKFRRQDQVWMAAVKEFADITEGKAEIMQLLSVRDQAQKQLRELHEKVQIMSRLLGDPKAALLTRQLAKDANCGSCKIPALMDPTAERFVPRLLPPARPAPVGAAEETDVCMQHMRQMRALEHARMEEKTHVCQRWCGGSHTLVSERVTREQAPPVIHAEVPTKPYVGFGSDGRPYKLAEDLLPCVECNQLAPDKFPDVPDKIPGVPEEAPAAADDGAGDQAPRINTVNDWDARRVTVLNEDALKEAPVLDEPPSRRATIAKSRVIIMDDEKHEIGTYVRGRVTVVDEEAARRAAVVHGIAERRATIADQGPPPHQGEGGQDI